LFGLNSIIIFSIGFSFPKIFFQISKIRGRSDLSDL
jgi:hypothetical protein